MELIMGDWGLRYRGISRVEHVFFYSVPGFDDVNQENILGYCILFVQRFLVKKEY